MIEDDCREILNSVVESTADGIYVVALDGSYILSNSRFHEMVHIPRSSVQSKNVIDILENIADQMEDQIAFLYWVHDITVNSKADIYIMRFQDARIFECYSMPLIQKGEITGRVWTFGDITQLKKTEETARLYLDLMSHDIRNRLQGIVMSVEILNLLSSNPDSATTIDDIEQNVNRCANLISKVKAAENIDEAPLTARSLPEALMASVEDIKQRFHSAYLDLSIEIKIATIQADKYLETLFTNLLENSIIHNPKEDRNVWVQLRLTDTGYDVSISDNGPGIDDIRKRDIFDKRRRYGGVGLHVASQIVSKYEGTLRVMDRIEGDSSQGADFHVWFPTSVVKWG
jgi:signal transduction histidine kinase